jgi:hypothetical protein
MGYEINWHSSHPSVKGHPLYQKWSAKTMSQIIAAKTTLASDMGSVLANSDSAPILSYLSWLAREVVLITSLAG